MPATAAFALGDVVRDDYANPAVIVRIEHDARGPRYSIMQTCGSDRGRVTSPALRDGQPVRCDQATPEQLEVIRAIVRAEARRQGLRWDAHGITR